MELILPAAVIAVLIALIAISARLERKRTAELAVLADEMSLSFFPDGDPMLKSSLDELPLMKRGHSRKLHNLIRGQTQSVDLSLFDYAYVTGSGKNRSVHKHSVAVFDSPQLHLPQFELTRENVLHKLAGAFGYQDIDFAGYPNFNRKYLLRGPNEKGIRNLFTEDVVQHFDAAPSGRRQPSVYASRSKLMVVTRRTKPHELRDFMNDAFAIYSVISSANVLPQPVALQEAVG